MMIRIFKKPNGKIIVQNPSPHFLSGDLTINDCPIPSDLSGLPNFTVDSDTIPNYETTPIEQFYINGDANPQNLTKDTSWTTNLMPVWMIQQDAIDSLKQQIESELSQQTPNGSTIAVLNAKLEQVKTKIAEKDYLYFAQMALDNLDASVAANNPDKPAIRAQLEALIASPGIDSPW